MAPATGYAEASSERVSVRNSEKIPDIGHATSYIGQLIDFFPSHRDVVTTERGMMI